jgi:hypothetical protein
MAQQQINPGSAPIIWSDVASAFDTINNNFTELYASVGGDAVDFTSLGTNLVPRTTEVYDLGTSSKRWRDLWLSGSSIHLGDAVITSTGTTVNLPVGSTIGGLRVDENYFKFISVAGQDSIEADDGTDTLTLASGNSGITLTTNATTDTVTITNSGVTSLTGTAGQIGVSQSTGGVTLTNLGVTSATAGQGINLNSGTGSVTITNSGVVGLDAGIGIQLSPRDPVTGVITVTNSQPNIPQQVFSIISVPTQTPIAADSTADTLTIETSGDGLSITTAPLTDTLTFTNTGVTSLAVGNGLTINAGTGSINLTLDATLSRNIVGDITGSVFADDSITLVDATEGLIVGDVDNSSVTTEFVYLKNTNYRLEIGEGDGNLYIWATSTDNDVIIRTNASGSGENDFIFGKDGNLTVPTGATITPENKTSGNPEDFIIRGQQTSGTSLSEGGNLYLDGGDGNVEEGYGNGALYLGTDSALIRIGNDGGGITELHGYVRLLPGSELDFQGESTLTNLSSITTDLIGSVFADDSTKLVDAVEGLIVGNVDTGRLRTSETKIALGLFSGLINQGSNAVAIGQQSGMTDQGTGAVAVGVAAGGNYQGFAAVAIGVNAGGVSQGTRSIAIGDSAGNTSQGDYAIAIGSAAGNLSQNANSIILNASGSALSAGAAGFFVAPVRNVDGGTFLNYNASTKEIGYSSDLRSEGNINIDINLADSTLHRWQFGEDGILTTPGSLSINSTFNFSTNGAGNQLASITVPSGGSLSIIADTSPVNFEGSSESNVVVIEDGDITANTVFATSLNTQDSSALLIVPPVNFQTTISTDQGIQLNGVDAIIRSDDNIRLVPTNSVESVGAELIITGLDVMGEPNVIIETATDQGTIQIGGENNNTASVTVRKSTGEVYVGGFWRFLADGGLYSGYLDAPPAGPTAGAFYVADGATWDPASKSGAVPYPVFYDGVSYHALY